MIKRPGAEVLCTLYLIVKMKVKDKGYSEMFKIEFSTILLKDDERIGIYSSV